MRRTLAHLALFLAALPATAQLPAAPPAKDHTCVPMTIECNSSVMGELTDHDCLDPSNFATDYWTFAGSLGSSVEARMITSAFAPLLYLLDPNNQVVAQNNPSSGQEVILTFDLTAPGLWKFAATHANDDGRGAYMLTLDCDNPPPVLPAPRHLVATSVSPNEVHLEWEDDSTTEDEFRIQLKPPGSGFIPVKIVPADTTQTEIDGLVPSTLYAFRLRAHDPSGNVSPFSNEAFATTAPPPPPPSGGCVASPTILCLNDGRFQVQVDFRDFKGNTGTGQVVQNTPSDDSGLFFFFRPDNWEMLIKVLDACDQPSQHFWVFAASTTNVEFGITVTDTETAVVKQYFNPLGQPAVTILDTRAFETCR